MEKMRKSLLTAIVMVALVSGAAPGVRAENTKQERTANHHAMATGIGDAAQESFLGSYLGNPPSETKLPTCTAESPKDVALNKNCR